MPVSTPTDSGIFFIMKKLVIKNRYATIPNDLVNSIDISLKAKGLFAYIQSKPDGWEFSAERISNQLKEGLPTINSALKELESNGYLKRERYQNEFGHWHVQYLLCEIPVAENLMLGNPVQENPNTGKPTNNIKQESIKQEINKTIEVNNKGEVEIVEFVSFRDYLFQTWFDYKKQKKSKYTEIGKAKLMKLWEGKTDDQLQSAIEHSIANNYQGLFEPKNNNSVIAEKKGKIQTNLENINAAQQAIKHNMKDGKVINNPFDISNW